MKIARLSVLGAPLLLCAYGGISLLGLADGRYGPGPDWQIAHALGIAGMGLFACLALGIRLLLAPGLAREMAVGATLIGATTSIVQFAADMVYGVLADDRAGMNALSRQVRALPGVDLVFYQVGPQLLFAGMIVLTFILAVKGTLPWWSPALVLAGSLLPLVTLGLIPVSALCYLIAFLPLRRKL
ncbi:hypothetical protein ACIBKY_31050 [Nonomuraea sp. NPDC050394]|uniref:hypothetical protein n=1 Tax=Nonomuraea sp. NPDC050394 TaxID=3364363 RepID=UPI003796AF84